MPVTLEDIAKLKSLNKALLALDLGGKRIGVAASDRTWMIASTLEVIQHEKFTLSAKRVKDLYDEKKSCAIVVGLPLNMDGTKGPRAQSAADFVRNFEELYPDIPIVLWDERLSTVAVETILVEADLSRKRRKEVIDKVAANYILQGFLDRMENVCRSTKPL
ncbi:MAG: Holliday junction resolvase RuvX [Alphaproteobacteria bacterium]|nr:Holliday junction resolvase RuvX [Alphaproteobacteria bacterium]NCQ67197.1 Holliday junction resolvase RuvX [Alphaproteobacteria bacterium]NCT07041.1 Holliday junction resolvase RuvX [Alphaproteobacteria bacterium]